MYIILYYIYRHIYDMVLSLSILFRSFSTPSQLCATMSVRSQDSSTQPTLRATAPVVRQGRAPPAALCAVVTKTFRLCAFQHCAQ